MEEPAHIGVVWVDLQGAGSAGGRQFDGQANAGAVGRYGAGGDGCGKLHRSLAAKRCRFGAAAAVDVQRVSDGRRPMIQAIVDVDVAEGAVVVVLRQSAGVNSHGVAGCAGGAAPAKRDGSQGDRTICGLLEPAQRAARVECCRTHVAGGRPVLAVVGVANYYGRSRCCCDEHAGDERCYHQESEKPALHAWVPLGLWSVVC